MSYAQQSGFERCSAVYDDSTMLSAVTTTVRLAKLALGTAALAQLVFPVAGECEMTAAADATQTRRYEVRIDNRPAGNYQLVLTQHGQSVDVASDCTVSYKFLIFHYGYKYHGHESWKGSRIQSFESDSLDDGKKCTVLAVASGDKLNIKVNGKQSAVAGATTLPSSYWRLPVAGGVSDSADFFEVDTGRLFKAEFRYHGRGSAQVGGKQLDCWHYKLSGGDSGDFLFDQQGRLVSQKFSDSGHETVIRLVDVSDR